MDIGARIDAFQEQKKNWPRHHFGVSTIGGSCERRLWYSFRWISPEKFPGRILRLFETGNMYENRIVNYLKDIGLDVRQTGRNQAKVDFGDHVCGSVDGIIFGEEKMVLEIKTHSKKSFDDVEKNGVEKSKPEHYAQMQGYMLGMGIPKALYFALAKDDERIYTEEVPFNQERAERFIRRAKAIAVARSVPAPVSTDPTWYECRFCPASSVCRGGEIKDVTCRSCRFADPAGGVWTCEKFGDQVIPDDFQLRGCDSHEFIDRDNNGHLSRNMVREGFDLAEPWLKVFGGEIE